MASTVNSGLQRKLSDSESLAKECNEVDEAIVHLKVAYEQYFLGMERHPPVQAHASLKQRVLKLKTAFARQTAVRFRIQALANKYLSYERLWARTLQEIESGTYRRDLFKAKLHRRPPTPDGPAPSASSVQRSEAPSASRLPSGVSDEKLRAVYEAFVEAKRQCNEDVSKVTFDNLAARLRQQVPELLRQHKAQSVDFKVVIKEGKVVLRAIPK